MTHAPPIPDAQQAPWPAHPAPRNTTEGIGDADLSAEAAPEPQAAHGGESGLAVDDRQVKRLGVGAAIGVAAIGSAAIAAALLYVNSARKE